MHDPRTLVRRAVDGFGARLTAVPVEAWDAPTPCEGWTVRDLVAHVVDEERWAPPLLVGQSADDVADRLPADPLGNDAVGAWRRASADVAGAIAEPGVVDATVRLPSGETTGAAFLMELFADHLVHTWDLARAVAADERLDGDLVEACAAWFDAHEEGWRDSGEIGPPVPVPDGADAQTRLLARFGRQVQAHP